eukprot:6233008-Prymnesium_polylepis.2
MAREFSDLKAKQAEVSKVEAELRKNQAAAVDMYLTGLRKCTQGGAARRRAACLQPDRGA